MSEAQLGGFQPETGPDFFSIEGDGRRFSLDKGEKLTENPEGTEEFGGFINLRDADGKEQKFPGRVVDGGDHWLVQRYDDKGDSEYRIPKSGVVPEAGRVVAEGIVPVAEAPVGGLEDAAAVAATEGAPTEAVAAPTPEPPPVAELQPQPEPDLELQPTPVVEVAKAVVEAAPEPELAELKPQPEIAAAPAETGRRLTVAEARQQFDKEFKDLDAKARGARYDSWQKNSLQQRAQELRTGAEEARNRVNKLRNKDRIAEAISEEGRLIAEAKKLEGQAAAITALEDTEIQAIEDRRQRARDLTQEVDRWGNLIENPALIEEYRGLDGRMQEDLAAAEKLFGGGNPEDQAVLDAARKRIEARTQVRRTELEAMFPRRFMELAGIEPRRDLGDAAADNTLDRDLIERYYQFADQFYAELTGGPKAVQPEMPPAPEQVIPQEPVEQPVVETTVEEAIPTAEAVAEPEVAEQAAEEAAASAPVEAPMTAEVVTDAEEQARAAAAKPVETVEEVPAPAEAAAETPEQRFERRKRGFAGALAGLEQARNDRSGTEGEQRVRLAEAYNQAIGAAMEFMNEGDGAREVVRGFLAGALGTPGGRKLTEVAVRSRMDEAGVTGAPAGEKKKKLEQAGLWGLLELLLELGMSFTDKTIGAVVSEVQSATGAGR